MAYKNFMNLRVGITNGMDTPTRVYIGNANGSAVIYKQIYIGNASGAPVLVACYSNWVCDCDCNCGDCGDCTSQCSWDCSDCDSPTVCSGDCGGNCDVGPGV